MSVILRRAQPEDREAVFAVERKSTPTLTYLPYVFDQFIGDGQGELIVAELDGQMVACGKFTLLPDGSAWLETLRVIPDAQGLGIGKQFYRRFFELARAKKVTCLRMYTGVRNFASKGLAERFGFCLAGTYRGQKRPCRPDASLQAPGASRANGFAPVTHARQAAELLQAYREAWAGFMVINRTFYALTPALSAYLAGQGMLYHDSSTGSTVCLGARFMPRQALHIGLLGGDIAACLGFALQLGMQRQVESLSCYPPAQAEDLHAVLAGYGFQGEGSDIIVMEANLP